MNDHPAHPVGDPFGSAVVCPRCGYDQRGAVKAWSRLEPPQCPLTGVCSECGLAWHWTDVLGQSKAAEAGAFEHARGVAIGSMLRTMGRSMWPPGFWRWMRMEYALRPGRIAVCVAIGFVLVYVLSGVIGIAHDIWIKWPWLVGQRQLTPPSMSQRFARWYSEGASTAWWCFGPRGESVAMAPVVAMMLLANAFMPIAYLGLPITFKRCRVRVVHLWRIAAYAWISAPAALWLGCIAASTSGLLSKRNFFSIPIRDVPVDWRWAVAILFAWQVVWWWAATKYYLKLPRPVSIATLLTLMSASAAFVVLLYWDDGWFLSGL